MAWNPDQYHKFQNQRSAPFDDLLSMVEIRQGLDVIDLGCGTGELTLRLFETLPESHVTGLDNSTSMLSRAEGFARLGLAFHLGDQSAIRGDWDLIISNAALQWSEDHPTLLAHLYSCLRPGGQIAVQVPSNHNHISHLLISETAGEEPFRTILNGFIRKSPVLPIEQYAQILFSFGAAQITVFEKVYPHVLENSGAVLVWVSGTALVPYFDRIGDAKQAFLARLEEKFKSAMPGKPVFYPFKRTFFTAIKPR